MTLGVGYVTPLQLANAYAAFAARGKYCTPLADHLGQGLRPASRSTIPGCDCKQVLAPEVADGVNEVPAPGDGAGRYRSAS